MAQQQAALKEDRPPTNAEEGSKAAAPLSSSATIGFDVKDKVAEVARKTPKTQSKSGRGEQIAYDFAAEQQKNEEAPRNNNQRQKRYVVTVESTYFFAD